VLTSRWSLWVFRFNKTFGIFISFCYSLSCQLQIFRQARPATCSDGVRSPSTRDLKNCESITPTSVTLNTSRFPARLSKRSSPFSTCATATPNLLVSWLLIAVRATVHATASRSTHFSSGFAEWFSSTLLTETSRKVWRHQSCSLRYVSMNYTAFDVSELWLATITCWLLPVASFFRRIGLAGGRVTQEPEEIFINPNFDSNYPLNSNIAVLRVSLQKFQLQIVS
jgi:hypothetical protein